MNDYKTLFNRTLRTAAIFVGLLVWVGCEQNEEPTSNEQAEGIVFHPTLDGQEVVVTTSQTRVADIDLKTFGFTVCGYQSVAGTFEDKKGQTTPNVFAGKSPETGGSFQVVNYDVAKKKFMTPERPWLVAKEDHLSFFAWSDNGAAGKKGITGHSNASATGYPTVDISVCNEIVDQPDIVAAHAIDLRNNALISAIDLQFKHILAKISFKGYSSSGTTIAIKAFDIKYSGSTKSKATYSFDPAATVTDGFPFIYDSASGHGTSSSYPVSSTPYPSVTEKNPTPATAVLLGSMMQIPQDAESGFITVRVKYSIEGTAGVAGPEQTREISIPAMKLEVGHHYILAFDFVADKIQVSVNSVADWNEMTSTRLPLVAGPRGDVMLWLDGGDAPYEFNGEKYWLDRSGYNRHCKMVNPNKQITYNAGNKVYQFKTYISTDNFTDYLLLEPLGSIDEVTLQLLMKTNASSNNYSYQTPLFYRKTTRASLPQDAERQLLIHFEDKGNIFDFDCYVGGKGNWLPKNVHGSYERMSMSGLTATQRNVYSLYTCRRKPGYKSIARNDNYESSWTGDLKDCPFILNVGYLGAQFDGDIKMLKILKSSIPYEQIESDYAYLKNLHKLPDDPIIPIGTLPSKSPNGLIAYFDANDPPTSEYNQYTNQTTYRWRDRTGYGNHLEISGYNSGISYDGTNKYYIFNGSNAHMRIVKSLGALKSYWVEFGLINEGVDSGGTTSGTTTERVLIHFTKDDRTASNDNGFIWYFPNKNNNLWGYNNGALYRFNDAGSSTLKDYTWGIGRSGNLFNIARGNEFFANASVSVGSYVPRLDYCYIGNNAAKTMPFKGKIKTIRIYNRVPTTTELGAMKDEVVNGIK